MDWSRHIREAARQSGHSLEADVVEELAAHAQSALDAAYARGRSLAEAEAHVHSLIGAWIVEAAALNRPANRTPPVVEPPPMAGGLVRGFSSEESNR